MWYRAMALNQFIEVKASPCPSIVSKRNVNNGRVEIIGSITFTTRYIADITVYRVIPTPLTRETRVLSMAHTNLSPGYFISKKASLTSHGKWLSQSFP